MTAFAALESVTFALVEKTDQGISCLHQAGPQEEEQVHCDIAHIQSNVAKTNVESCLGLRHKVCKTEQEVGQSND